MKYMNQLVMNTKIEKILLILLLIILIYTLKDLIGNNCLNIVHVMYLCKLYNQSLNVCFINMA